MDTEHEIRVELHEDADGMRLETNLYEFLGDFTDRMINTEILGTAFEPDQPFENRDGTPITFDRDYFGSPRGLRPLPGPFASAGELEKPL